MHTIVENFELLLLTKPLYVPSSTILPASIIKFLSEFVIVESLWAITIMITLPFKLFMLSIISISDELSKALVASSKSF